VIIDRFITHIDKTTNMSNSNHSVENRQKLFTGLYKTAFPAVARYISRLGGSLDEAKDVFQDALVIYYEKMIAKALPEKNIGYLIGTSQKLWLQRYRENNRQTPLNNTEIAFDEDQKPADKRLMHFLSTTGKKCMELLKAFYYDDVPLKDLADSFGYSSVRSVTVQKHKCLEKVRETVKQKALSYADFME
jgi:DNA-directed RNA polymerase specialized sigma24 family protein